MISNICFLIKTFKRYKCLEKLLLSIDKYYPSAKVYVADDNSEQEFREDFYQNFNVTLFRLPYDSGLSYGRNYIVEHTTEPFIFLLDDDFVFTEKTDLFKLVTIMVERPEIGIVGGLVYEFGQEIHYEHYIKFDGNCLWEVLDGDHWEDVGGVTCKKTGCVLNFGLFKRALLAKIKWDNRLKIVEHRDFYLQMMRHPEWKIYYTPEVSVIHDKARNIGDYNQFRMRWQEFFEIVYKKWGIQKEIKLNGRSMERVGEGLFKKKYLPQYDLLKEGNNNKDN